MHLSWLGNTAMKLQVKPFDQDVTIVIDTYKPDDGMFPRSLTADIALYTGGEKNSITISGNPFVLQNPGECETKGVLLTGVEGKNAGELSFRIDAEQLSLAHLGTLNRPLTDHEMEVLSDVDIVCIPVGGTLGYEPALAAKVANSLEPRIIIPIAYKSDTDPKALPVEKFLSEMGAKAETAEKKIIIKKKDLPEEETKVIVVSKE